jgi:hypothetical protein
VYVIARLHRADALPEPRPVDENDVMLTKAFFSADDAKVEAARLNGLDSGLWVYFVRVARLVEE